MLPKKLRLHGRSDFESIFRSRKVISGPEISLFFLSNGEIEPRIGFSFKQKAFPKAATRHFLKRKGSAIMRELLPSLPRGIDVVVLFHRPFERPVTYVFLKEMLQYLVKRLNQAKI